MTTDPFTQINTRTTPQAERADARQVKNNAGGYVFNVDTLHRLRRFLTLGVEGGTYYVGQSELTRENAQVVIDFAQRDATTLVDEIVQVSTSGRAPKQQPALFALAIAASLANQEGRRYALDALPKVARTATHLFTFVKYAQQFRGWGRSLKRAVAQWYLTPPQSTPENAVNRVAYQMVKYRNREGFTHRDLLRLSHPTVAEDDYARRATFDWTLNRDKYTPEERLSGVDGGDAPKILEGFERAQQAEIKDVPSLVRDYALTWEMLPDAALKEPAVWEALLDVGIPITALMRQLPRLTNLGLLDPLGAYTKIVVNRLTDAEALKRGRVHPIAVLVAQRTYASGVGFRGSSTWNASRPIVDALDAAFYASFGAVEPTGKSVMLALDVSGSMSWGNIGGTPLTPRDATAALSLVTANVEDQYEIVGFTSGGGYGQSLRGTGLTPLSISPRQRLDDAIRTISNLPFGGTDCSLPMRHALQRKQKIDTFVVYTDNETWAGPQHVHQALREYREKVNPEARLVVVGMTATDFTIADPNDPDSLDVAGFDAGVPTLISDFARGVL